MTAPIVFGRLHVLPVVVDFLKAYPDINLRLMLGDRLSNLVEDHIDVALRIGNLPDSNLIATRLGAIRRTVYASPDYLKRHALPRHPGDLAAHDCVTFESMASMLSWTFTEGKHDLTVQIRSRLAVNTAEAAVDAAVALASASPACSPTRPHAQRAPSLLVPLLADFEPPPSAGASRLSRAGTGAAEAAGAARFRNAAPARDAQQALKRVPIFQIRLSRFWSLF